jgi:hypothetical protein
MTMKAQTHQRRQPLKLNPLLNRRQQDQSRLELLTKQLSNLLVT